MKFSSGRVLSLFFCRLMPRYWCTHNPLMWDCSNKSWQYSRSTNLSYIYWLCRTFSMVKSFIYMCVRYFRYESYIDVEIQQRAVEYFELSRKGAALADVLAEMPKFPEREVNFHPVACILTVYGIKSSSSHIYSHTLVYEICILHVYSQFTI